MIEFEESASRGPRIKVIGVGGGGGNAINNMIERGIAGVEFLVANTDIQALGANRAPQRLQLGKEHGRQLAALGDEAQRRRRRVAAVAAKHDVARA